MCRWSCILTSRSPIVEPLGQVEGDEVLERVEHGSRRDEELPVCEVALGLGKICIVCQLTPRPERNSRTREENVEHRWERQEGKGRGLHQVYSTRLMGLQTYVIDFRNDEPDPGCQSASAAIAVVMRLHGLNAGPVTASRDAPRRR